MLTDAACVVLVWCTSLPRMRISRPGIHVKVVGKAQAAGGSAVSTALSLPAGSQDPSRAFPQFEPVFFPHYLFPFLPCKEDTRFFPLLYIERHIFFPPIRQAEKSNIVSLVTVSRVFREPAFTTAADGDG